MRESIDTLGSNGRDRRGRSPATVGGIREDRISTPDRSRRSLHSTVRCPLFRRGEKGRTLARWRMINASGVPGSLEPGTTSRDSAIREGLAPFDRWNRDLPLMDSTTRSDGDPTMSRLAADRNLLFGILALQMDFISRDALIAAMNAWVLEKHRPLADLLEERGALSPGRPRPARAAGPPAHRAARRRPGPEPRRAQLGRLAPRRPGSAVARRPRRAGQPGRPRPRSRARADGASRRWPATIARRHRRPPRSACPAPRAAVPHPPAPRPGRAGRGLRRPRRGAAPRGGAQADPGPARRRSREPLPVPARGRDHRRAGASRHRAGLRPGPLRRRPAVLRHAVHQGRQPQGGDRALPRRPSRPADGPRRADAGASASCCGGSSTSATRSPTPTAGACCTATSSRATSCWASTARRWWWTGAWPRSSGAVRRVLGRGDAPPAVGQRVERDAARLGDRHAGVHEPRAGRRPARSARPGQRRLQPGRDALLPADRPRAVRGTGRRGRCCGRCSAASSRRRGRSTPDVPARWRRSA